MYRFNEYLGIYYFTYQSNNTNVIISASKLEDVIREVKNQMYNMGLDEVTIASFKHISQQ